MDQMISPHLEGNANSVSTSIPCRCLPFQSYGNLSLFFTKLCFVHSSLCFTTHSLSFTINFSSYSCHFTHYKLFIKPGARPNFPQKEKELGWPKRKKPIFPTLQAGERFTVDPLARIWHLFLYNWSYDGSVALQLKIFCQYVKVGMNPVNLNCHSRKHAETAGICRAVTCIGAARVTFLTN